MSLTSPYWNEELGVCEKHMLPSVPCPACIASNDSDMERRPTALDMSGWSLDDDDE